MHKTGATETRSTFSPTPNYIFGRLQNIGKEGSSNYLDANRKLVVTFTKLALFFGCKYLVHQCVEYGEKRDFHSFYHPQREK